MQWEPHEKPGYCPSCKAPLVPQGNAVACATAAISDFKCTDCKKQFVIYYAPDCIYEIEENHD